MPLIKQGEQFKKFWRGHNHLTLKGFNIARIRITVIFVPVNDLGLEATHKFGLGVIEEREILREIVRTLTYEESISAASTEANEPVKFTTEP